jgi:hypothetical protein
VTVQNVELVETNAIIADSAKPMGESKAKRAKLTHFKDCKIPLGVFIVVHSSMKPLLTVDFCKAAIFLSAVQLVCLPSSLAQSQTQWSLTLPDGPNRLSMLLVDWNLDSRPDVLITTGTGVNVYDGANGTLQWAFTPSAPGVGWSAFGPFGIRESSFTRYVPPDVDGDGLPDFLYGFSIRSMTASTIVYSNTLGLFDIGSKTNKWQRSGILTPTQPLSSAGLFNETPPLDGRWISIGSVDADSKPEVVFLTGVYDFIAGRYNNCGVTILDGATGMTRTNISFGTLTTYFTAGLRLIDLGQRRRAGHLSSISGSVHRVFRRWHSQMVPDSGATSAGLGLRRSVRFQRSGHGSICAWRF